MLPHSGRLPQQGFAFENPWAITLPEALRRGLIGRARPRSPGLAGVDATRGWACSKLTASAHDEVDVLDFLTTVERFLVRMSGVIVDPAVLTVEQFARAYLPR